MKIKAEQKELLSGAGLKATRGRLAVLDILKRNPKPVDASGIRVKLKRSGITIDLVTVYRTLDTLCEKMLVRRVEFGEGKYRYELARDDHHHLICEKCGEVEDIALCPVADLEKDINQRQKFLVKRHSLEFFGLCQQCQ